MTGAGFGGCAVAVCRRGDAEGVLQRLRERGFDGWAAGAGAGALRGEKQ